MAEDLLVKEAGTSPGSGGEMVTQISAKGGFEQEVSPAATPLP